MKIYAQIGLTIHNMDPLSVLSVVGNAVQFVQFTFGLLNSSKKIYNSASGSSADCEDLKKIYSKLSTFSNQLVDTSFTVTNAALDHTSEIQEIARACKEDCEKLLDLVNKLRLKSKTSKIWWQSFSKAILELWSSKDLENLKIRIADARGLLILKLCAVSW